MPNQDFKFKKKFLDFKKNRKYGKSSHLGHERLEELNDNYLFILLQKRCETLSLAQLQHQTYFDIILKVVQ